MPSPIGHSLAGLALFFFSVRRRLYNWKLLFIALFAAILPDCDFLFGFVIGQPNKYHHQFTHSVIFVIIAGLALALLIRERNRVLFLSNAILFSLMGILHLTLDSLCVDTSAPFGLQILWPFTEKFYIFYTTPLLDIQRSSESATFFSSMFSWHNFKAISLEIVIFAPLVYLAYFLNRNKVDSND